MPAKGCAWSMTRQRTAVSPGPLRPALAARLAPRPDRGGELPQHRHRRLPGKTGVGDGLAVHEVSPVLQVLTALHEKGLEHHADDPGLALGDLRRHVAGHDGLAPEVMVAVAVARIHHEARRQLRVRERGERLLHVARVVVGALLTSAQDDVAVGVAARRDDARQALLGDAEEAVVVRGGAHGVDRDLHGAVGAVLEADRHREARGELAVHLALRGARADRAPRHEVRDELRRDRIEELAARRKAQLGEVEQEAARQPQPLVDREGAVEDRVVDEALPAHGGARLLEVDAHDDAEVLRQLVGDRLEAARVLEPRLRIVDRAGAHDDDQAVALAAQDAGDFLARAGDDLRALVAQRQLLEEDRRRQQRPDALDVQVAGLHGVPIVLDLGRISCSAPSGRMMAAAMITKFATVYPGHVDLPDMGQRSTPANERRFSNEHLATVFEKTEAIARTMDELDYHAIWLAEHHFQHEGYECLPNILMLAVHLAHVTPRIRIGCGFNIAPMWPPLRLAEDFATADILTRGRVIFGVGRGYHTREVETFGAPMLDAEANRELFEEQVEIILRAFNEESFAHHGKHYTLPPAVPYRGYELRELTLVPRPVHRPVECWQPIVSASRRGLDFMVRHGIKGTIGGGAATMAEGPLHAYREAAARAGRNLALGEDLCLGIFFYLAETREKAIREITPFYEEHVKMFAPLGFVPGITPAQVEAAAQIGRAHV